MKTATETDLGGDSGTMLRWLRIAADSASHAAETGGGWRYRLMAWEIRWHRRRLRKLMTPR